MSSIHRPMARKQHVDPHLEGSETETDIPPDVLRGLGQITRPERTSESCPAAPDGLRQGRAETRGPRQGTARQTRAQAQVPPATSSGPLPALLLTPLPGHRRTSREAGCQVMGWEGRPLSGLGTVRRCPAQPCQALTRQPSTRPLSDGQTISPSVPGQPGGVPCTCFSLAPVSDSLGVS